MKSAFQFTVRFAKSKALIPILAGVLVMCMIAAPAAMVASVLGLSLPTRRRQKTTSSRPSRRPMSMRSLHGAKKCCPAKSYDQVVYEGNYANDVEVLAVFAVKTTEKDGLM